MLRVVHVDERAQGRALGLVLPGDGVHLDGGQQRPGSVEEQGILSLDLHDVAVPGDGQERLEPGRPDPVDRGLAAQQRERLMQPGFVGVHGRVGQGESRFGHGEGHQGSPARWFQTKFV